MTGVYIWDGSVAYVPDTVYTKKQAAEALNINLATIAAVRVQGDNRPITVTECNMYCKEKCKIKPHQWNSVSLHWALHEWQCSCTSYSGSLLLA
jgi:hypothetical protein